MRNTATAGAGMPSYRFHLRTKDRLRQMREAEYSDDEHAKRAAERRLNAADPAITSVEVWQGTRLVWRMERNGRG